jgi:NAD(P)-dependent dehydrogenase (short-subunit alcohol dehydrogenase family)
VSILAGKVAVVTGASRGIGRVTADRLEEAGAKVACLARSLSDGSTDTRCDVRCDVTREADVHRAVEQVLAAFGPPHIVINNAGAFLLKSLVQTTREEFAEQVDVNLLGPFLVLREFLPHLPRDGTAHLVTIGSVVDHCPYPDNAAYGASKYGVRGLHEVMSEELRGSGIRSTLISPGATDTKLWDALDPDARGDVPNRKEMLLPTDVADVVLFAVSRPAHVNVEWIRVLPAG